MEHKQGEYSYGLPWQSNALDQPPLSLLQIATVPRDITKSHPILCVQKAEYPFKM
jgi:hypothetical protein